MGDYLMSIIKMKYYAKLGIITGTDPLDWMMEGGIPEPTTNSSGNLDPIVAADPDSKV